MLGSHPEGETEVDNGGVQEMLYAVLGSVGLCTAWLSELHWVKCIAILVIKKNLVPELKQTSIFY